MPWILSKLRILNIPLNKNRGLYSDCKNFVES